MRIARIASLVAAVALVAGPRFASAAGTATSSFAVRVNVPSNCRISTTALDFVTYDPNNATAQTGTSTVSLTCTQGSSATVTLTSANIFRMVDGASHSINYGLYSDANHSAAWNGTSGVAYNATNMNQTNYTVYGSIPTAQDVPLGNYSDTVTASVNF